MTGRHLVAAFSVPAALCALWTVHAGKDVNWDLLNYHYYLPFELLHGRLHQDFFAASAQSYLNPVGYLPFYAMLAAGWHSVIASIALALFHSLNVGLLYLIAWRLFAHRTPHERILFSALAAALGVASPVFWPTIGSSFLDPSLTVLTLGAVLLLLADPMGRRAAGVAGALLGAATALKYSNAIFAVAALPLVLGSDAGRSPRLHRALAYGGGAALALGLLAGPWLAMLGREFGNPVFPMLNGWFGSPDAPPINGLSVRFVPQHVADVLAFPFRMAWLDRSLYVEAFAPDIRVGALIVGAIVLAACAARGLGSERALRSADGRLLGFVALSATLWLATSANGRYGMPVLLLTGVCLARIVERLLPTSVARVALALALVVQLAIGLVAAPTRWFLAEPWSARWLPFDVPERAVREPALYLTLDVLTMSAVVPFLHPGSSFVNVRGQHSLAPDSPRLATLLQRHNGHVRALGRGLALVDGRPLPAEVRAYDATLYRIGYRVDPDECFAITWRPDSGDPLSRFANRLAASPTAPEPLSLGSCALRRVPTDGPRAAEERRVSAVFDRIEAACPQIFHGHTAVTDPLGDGWTRNYTELDARLEARGDRLFLNRYRAGTAVELGRLGDWEADRIAPACQ